MVVRTGKEKEKDILDLVKAEKIQRNKKYK